MSDEISVSKQDGIIRIVLTRPDKMNALTRNMYGQMADAFADAEEDRCVRAILISGSGGNFTGGNDLADFMGSPEFGPDAPVNRFLKAIMVATVPVIAAVSGYVVGVGTTMLLHFDKVIATRDARFKMPFVDIGTVPEAASTLLLPQKMGYTRAADLVMTGKAFSGEEAWANHIATDLVDDEAALEAAAKEAAALIASKPPSAMRATKRLMRGETARLLDAMLAEGVEFGKALASPECHEALAAFAEKRAPDFSKFEAS